VPVPDAKGDDMPPTACEEDPGKTDNGAKPIVSNTVATLREASVGTDAANAGTTVEESVVLDPDESDRISIAETVMSIKGSSCDDAQSLSTCGSSVSASGSRKGVADESPERGGERSTRRDFQGRVWRSAAGCRVYVPRMDGDVADYPGGILNNNGTIAVKVTEGQEDKQTVERGGEIDSTIGAGTEVVPPLEDSTEADPLSTSAPFPATSAPDLPVEGAVASNNRPEVALVADFEIQGNPISGPSIGAVARSDATTGTDAFIAQTPTIVLIDEWGRDTCVINEICALIEAKPQPWSAYRVFEAASARFVLTV